MRIIIALTLAILAAIPVAAQQQGMTPEQYQALIQAVRQQRDAASDQVAQLSAQLTLVSRELADLKAKSAENKSSEK